MDAPNTLFHKLPGWWAALDASMPEGSLALITTGIAGLLLVLTVLAFSRYDSPSDYY